MILKDIACYRSLSPGVYARGIMVIAQRLLHRLDTRKGELRGSADEENFGIKLSDYVGSIMNESQERSFPDLIRNELTRDNAVESCSVTVKSTREGGALSFLIRAEIISSSGPFVLNLLSSSVTTELLGVS